MNLNNINPYIRFADHIRYKSEGEEVVVGDCRIFYVLSGSGTITVENQDCDLTQVYDLTEKKLFFCREGSRYKLTSTEGISLVSLNFDLTTENTCIKDVILPFPAENPTSKYDNNLNKSNKLNKLSKSDELRILRSDCDFAKEFICLENARKYAKPLDDILSEFKFRKLYFRERSSGILKIILIDLMRGLSFTSNRSENVVSDIILYITENYAEDITNKELASMAGYHEYHLNRLFVKQTGQSLHQYILTVRLNEAKRLMRMSDLSVAEIADRTGFNSCTHFSAYFKRAVGLTPYQYRRNFMDLV